MQNSTHLKGDSSPAVSPRSEIHIEPDPAIELGTKLANFLVPVILVGFLFGAIYGLRALSDSGPSVTVQPPLPASRESTTRSASVVAQDPLLGNLTPRRPLPFARGLAGPRPGMPLQSPGESDPAAGSLPSGNSIEVAEGPAVDRLILHLEFPGTNTQDRLVLEGISFDRSTSRLTTESEPAIQRLSSILRDRAASATLIEREATLVDATRAVHRRLIDLGLDRARIEIQSLGGSEPTPDRIEASAPNTVRLELVRSPHS